MIIIMFVIINIVYISFEGNVLNMHVTHNTGLYESKKSLKINTITHSYCIDYFHCLKKMCLL